MADRTEPGAGPTGVSEQRRRTLPPAFVAVAIATSLVVCLAVHVQMRRKASAERLARLSFCSVWMALHNYSDVHGHLPYQAARREATRRSGGGGLHDASGGALYGWRVEIVYYLQAWRGAFDPSEAWDSPANGQLAEMSAFYAFGTAERGASGKSFPVTNMLAITGPGTAFGDGAGQPMALKDVPPSTIVAVETKSSRIPWPAPGDFDIRTMPRTVGAPDGSGISGQSAGAFHVMFADGEVWLLSEKVSFDALSRFFTTDSAKKNDRHQLLWPFVVPRGA